MRYGIQEPETRESDVFVTGVRSSLFAVAEFELSTSSFLNPCPRSHLDSLTFFGLEDILSF